MRSLVVTLTGEAFLQQLGPFVLIQRPPAQIIQRQTQMMGLPMNVAGTQVVKQEDVSQATLAMLFQFDDLMIATLPPLQGVDELSVGRQPDCDVVIDDPSVSKRHALIRWDDAQKRCSVQDLGSTNGTFLNASVMVRRETALRDGDIVSFGDVPFWFLLSSTLYGRLKAVQSTGRLGSFSG